MTCEEQDAYLDAVTKLKEAGIYDDFSRAHSLLTFDFTRIHLTADFFPWHRWFVYVFERELQKIVNSCDMFVPYWSWVRFLLLFMYCF